VRVLLFCAVASAVVAGAALGAAPIAKRTPGATLKAEIAAFDKKDYAAAYSAYTPRFKARCPYATFRKHTAAQRAMVPPSLSLSVKVTSTRIVGAKAYLAYNLILAGQVVHTVKASAPDLFVRIKGLWYDQLDPQTTC
jgi:hypothetical protein